MISTSIYDRISQKRDAAEALARKQAEEERAAVEASINQLPEPASELPLNVKQNALRFAGLNVLMPAGFSFRDLQTTLEFSGCEVTFSVQLRAAPEGIGLPRAVDQYVNALRERHPNMTLVRRANSSLAGRPATAIDYLFPIGRERRHGRAVCAIIATDDGSASHWLEVSTSIDPGQARLADWLIEFDAMLAAITA